MGGLLSFFGIGDVAISIGSDKNPEIISARGKETFLGHFPSGTSYRAGNHFRQLLQKNTF